MTYSSLLVRIHRRLDIVAPRSPLTGPKLLKRRKYGLIGALWTFGSRTIVRRVDAVIDSSAQRDCIDTIQRGFSTEPEQLTPTSGMYPTDNVES